jgi:hypothetical protein
MPMLPRLSPFHAKEPDDTDSVVLAVYAPFGTDELLGQYPNDKQAPIDQQAMVRALQRVAECGVHVSALVDLYDDDSYLVEIPAGCPSDLCITSAWKQDMSSPLALAGFLRRTHDKHKSSALLLALEGHGAGYLPDIDGSKITASNVTGGGAYEWLTSQEGTTLVPRGGSPALPFPSVQLPFPSVQLPGVRMPMSTYGLGFALRHAIAAGVRKPAVIHLNNCLNMSVEILHTVSHCADFATAYCNSNFFIAGEPYVKVFQQLQKQGSASPKEVAQWFADENQRALKKKGNHPTIGCVVELARMPNIVDLINALARALVTALQTAHDRPALVQLLQEVIEGSQQYDTEPTAELEVPDQLTDIGSFAAKLLGKKLGLPDVERCAKDLSNALRGIKRYGDSDIPWVAPSTRWDFTDSALAMNIFLPDPTRSGRWDWRSPYYLDGHPNPPGKAAQRFVIDFLRNTGTPPPWVQFIVEYHKDVVFKGFLPVRAPVFPIFNSDYKPDDPCSNVLSDKPPSHDGRRHAS